MARFRASVNSVDVVAAPRDEVWEVLTDPDTLARLTPRVDRIIAEGDCWTWVMSGFSALGVSIEPSFTERMELDPKEWIRYWHDPKRTDENAGADGEYRLREVEGGTEVCIDITVHVDLPLPKVTRRAVERVMLFEMGRTGDRFAANLRRHLGI